MPGTGQHVPRTPPIILRRIEGSNQREDRIRQEVFEQIDQPDAERFCVTVDRFGDGLVHALKLIPVIVDGRTRRTSGGVRIGKLAEIGKLADEVEALDDRVAVR
jgi:hypothetical protein